LEEGHREKVADTLRSINPIEKMERPSLLICEEKTEVEQVVERWSLLPIREYFEAPSIRISAGNLEHVT